MDSSPNGELATESKADSGCPEHGQRLVGGIQNLGVNNLDCIASGISGIAVNLSLLA
jgi:hypothetical protein